MKITRQAIPYILFQRTQYIKRSFLHKAFAKLLRTFKKQTGLQSMVTANSLLSSSQIKKDYAQDMKNEMANIKSHLPSHAKSILDIGSGIAGIDVLISQHYGHNINVALLDKSTIDNDLHYDLEEKGSFYNSLQLAKQNLIINGVKTDHIHLIEANDNNTIDIDLKFDLIISLISWGFHYPVNVYLDEVYKKLNEGGVLILDVRKESDGIEQLHSKFSDYTIIGDFPKHQRVKLTK